MFTHKIRIVFLLVLLSTFSQVKIYAQNPNGLTISPALVIGPHISGESKSYIFKVFTDIDKTVDVSLKLLEKTSNLLKPTLSDAIPEELVGWFSYEKQFRIKKDDLNEYALTINSAPGFIGNYNFALVFTESTPTFDDSSNITFASSDIAIPIILNIMTEDGEFYEALDVDKLNVAPTISFDGKNSFNVGLKNAGISYLIPRGVLLVEPINTLIGSEKESITINEDKQVLLRDGHYDFDIEKNFTDYSFGRYKATLAVVYGTKNDVITKEIYFWKFPQWFTLSATAILLVLLILLLKKVYKNKQAYKINKFTK